MRQQSLVAATAALAAGVLVSASPSEAAPVLVFERGTASAREERALDAPVNAATSRSRSLLSEAKPSCASCPRLRRDGSVRAARSSSAAIRRAVERAHLAGQIEPGARGRYLADYASALRTLKGLSGQRRVDLGYVITTLGRIARAGRLSADRMPALFLTLRRNREWWVAKSPPASGARVRFGTSRLLFQYYPGRGLQIQPLGNFGLANGYWYGRNDSALRALVDELAALRVNRSGFSTWEYYFHFGGGSPPWISGMAQATAMQAFSRAAERLGDPGLLEIARQGTGAFERRTPVGVRVQAGANAWYALYSFAPGLQVLNGMLQSLIGLETYSTNAADGRARALFELGDRAARARIGEYDTGAWSLYSRVSGRPGPEADLNYHTLNRDFSRRLCRVTKESAYCDAARRFTRYLSEDPSLEPYRAAPAPAVGGRPVSFRFRLSKIGRVGIVVRASGRTYLSTSAPFSRGERLFRWIPPRLRSERTYEYQLFARDLAGNRSSVNGTIRVKRSGR